MTVSLLARTERRQWLADVLLEYVRHRRWFRAKARTPRDARVFDVVPLDAERVEVATQALVLLEIGYVGGDDLDLYAIPVAFADVGAAASAGRGGQDHTPQGMIADRADGTAPLVDGLVTGQSAMVLLTLLRDGGRRRGEAGELVAEPSPVFSLLAAADQPGSHGEGEEGWTPRVPHGEQTNSTVTFGHRLQMKIYRHLSAGPNPELEVGRFLTEHCQPPCAPRVAGALTYTTADGAALSLGIAHEYLSNDGDAWSLALGELRAFLGEGEGARRTTTPRFPSLAETLGRRTGELHRALCGGDSSAVKDADFAPEPLSASDRASLAERARKMLDENLTAVERTLDLLSGEDRALARGILAGEGRRKLAALIARFEEEPIVAMKTRTHGDLHLGQVLVRGDDFVIIDFEGEPARPLADRRAKNSPFRDVMGMVRSFAYAPEAALRDAPPETDAKAARARANLATGWTREVTARYLRGYLETVGDAPFVPQAREELSLLLAFHELERVVYEIGYELNNRPDWVSIPLRGLAAIAGVTEEGAAVVPPAALDPDDDGRPHDGRPPAGSSR